MLVHPRLRGQVIEFFFERLGHEAAHYWTYNAALKRRARAA
jgi:hypothetical protein